MSADSVFPAFVHKANTVFWSRKYSILTLYLLAVWLAILLCLRALPTYQATAIVSIKPAPLFNTDIGRIAAERPEQFARPQLTLLESETVVRRAIAIVGEERIYRANAGTQQRPKPLEWLRSWVRYFNPNLTFELSSADNAYMYVKKNLTIRSEPQTDIILIAFKSPDAHVAVEFTNALVQSFSRRYFEIYGNTGALGFFADQKQKSELQLSLASTRLAQYSSKFSLFGVDEQRRLLLQQRSGLSAALAVTHGAISDKTSQVAAMSAQLEQMRQPLARSPQLKGLTDQKGRDSEQASAPKSAFLGSIADDPPILLVRVYQDTVANLVHTNADVAGLKSLEVEQKKSLSEIDDELIAMASREAEIDQLRVAVTESKGNVEVFSKKAFEEQLAQDLNERKFSPVQTLQEATRPLEPTWPRPFLLLALGVGLSFVPLLLFIVIKYAIAGEAYSGRAGKSVEPRVPVVHNFDDGGPPAKQLI
jgi:polysaccharide biosynthesis transport protein